MPAYFYAVVPSTVKSAYNLDPKFTWGCPQVVESLLTAKSLPTERLTLINNAVAYRVLDQHKAKLQKDKDGYYILAPMYGTFRFTGEDPTATIKPMTDWVPIY